MIKMYEKYEDRDEDGIKRGRGWGGHVGWVRGFGSYIWNRLTKKNVRWTIIFSKYQYDWHIMEWSK